MGTNDLAKELQAAHVPGRQPLLQGLGLCLLAARAAGKVILDGVYNDIKDEAGFLAECEQGRDLGFDGKTLIHPSQVEPCNATFAPSAEDVEKAGRIIAAFEEAEAAGRASSPSTAAWSRTCTSSRPAAPWPSRPPSTPLSEPLAYCR